MPTLAWYVVAQEQAPKLQKLKIPQLLTVVSVASGYNAYRGATTKTRCPRDANAGGSDPQTSPRPPVLLQGATCGTLAAPPYCELEAGV